jgi:starch synthase
MAADAVTAVSPTFARELATPEGGFGLDGVLRARAGATVGILNGIDTEGWNPATDGLLPARYDAARLEGKAACRRALLERAGMDPSDTNLVVGFIGRLVEQKGLGLLLPVIERLLDTGIRFIVVGTGNAWLEDALRSINRPGRFHAELKFDEPLSHLVEAGSDAFLMPSLFEPCGLNQLYSLAYATPPIVRRTGGLADTVSGYDGTNLDRATGFVFDAPTPDALATAVLAAAATFARPAEWQRLIQNGMAEDHSWRTSAAAYLTLYRSLREH